jgi:Leucine rich repeat
MSLILFLLFLLSCTSPNLLAARYDDETALLKMKQQLGNPDILSGWVKGFDFCETAATRDSAVVYTTCTDTGRLYSLQMKNLDINASFPDAICSFTALESLEIYHFPGLHGSIASCITKLSNLSLVVMVETSLSGSVPRFSKNTNLKVINLSKNQLSGKIPPSFSTLPNLVSLDLSSNYLTGAIPPGIIPGSWSMLFLTNNNLTGEIPKTYSSSDLWIFDVGNNQLHGDASFLFGKQKIAVNIGLANNNFEFDLSHVDFSDKLFILNLSHNKIYRRVPESFATAAGLQYPDLSFNRLCGELPQGGDMGRFSAAVFANNTCLCGYPLPPCFNSAPAPAPAPVSI